MRYGGHRTYKYNYTSVYLCPVPKARLENFVLDYALSLLKRQTHFQTFQKVKKVFVASSFRQPAFTHLFIKPIFGQRL